MWGARVAITPASAISVRSFTGEPDREGLRGRGEAEDQAPGVIVRPEKDGSVTLTDTYLGLSGGQQLNGNIKHRNQRRTCSP